MSRGGGPGGEGLERGGGGPGGTEDVADMLVTVEDPMALEDPGVEAPHNDLPQQRVSVRPSRA